MPYMTNTNIFISSSQFAGDCFKLYYNLFNSNNLKTIKKTCRDKMQAFAIMSNYKNNIWGTLLYFKICHITFKFNPQKHVKVNCKYISYVYI